MISFITFLNLSKVKAKYEKGKISVPWELSNNGTPNTDLMASLPGISQNLL